MVAPGDDARPARRAQRRRVHVGVAQAVRGETRRGSASRSGCRNSPAARTRCRRARRSARSARRRGRDRARPRRARLIGRPPDHAGERSAGLVLDDRHPGFSRQSSLSAASPYPAVRWQSPHHPAWMTRVEGLHTASTLSPCCLHMPIAALEYRPRAGRRRIHVDCARRSPQPSHLSATPRARRHHRDAQEPTRHPAGAYLAAIPVPGSIVGRAHAVFITHKT